MALMIEDMFGRIWGLEAWHDRSCGSHEFGECMFLAL